LQYKILQFVRKLAAFCKNYLSEGNIFPQNVDKFLPDYTTPHTEEDGNVTGYRHEHFKHHQNQM